MTAVQNPAACQRRRAGRRPARRRPPKTCASAPAPSCCARRPSPPACSTPMTRAPRGGAISEAAGSAIEALLERELQPPEPSEEACRRHHAAHAARYAVGERVRVRHVLFAVTPGVDVNALRQRAEACLLDLRCRDAGARSTASRRPRPRLSNCPSGAQGGDLGWLDAGDCAPEFARELFGRSRGRRAAAPGAQPLRPACGRGAGARAGHGRPRSRRCARPWRSRCASRPSPPRCASTCSCSRARRRCRASIWTPPRPRWCSRHRQSGERRRAIGRAGAVVGSARLRRPALPPAAVKTYSAQMQRSWTLATKLGAIGGVLLLMALASIGLTLWVTWQLEGGAAAVNEAGRMRMQTWRLAQTLAAGDAARLQRPSGPLRPEPRCCCAAAIPSRPLFVPQRRAIRRRALADVQRGWQDLRGAGPPRRPGRRRGRGPGRGLRRAHRRLRHRHREPARALDRTAERLPVRDDGAGAGQRGGAAVLRLPVRLQPAGAPAGGAGPRRRRRPVGTGGGGQQRRVRRALGRLQPHGADAAGPVPEPRGPGAGEDAAPGDRACPRLAALYEAAAFVATRHLAGRRWRRALPARCGAWRAPTRRPCAGPTNPTSAT